MATAKKTTKSVKSEDKAATKKAAAKPSKTEKPKITKDMTIGEAVSRYPQTMEVLFRYGLHCIGCHVSAYETLEQGAMAHGVDEKGVKQMIEEMNKKI